MQLQSQTYITCLFNDVNTSAAGAWNPVEEQHLYETTQSCGFGIENVEVDFCNAQMQTTKYWSSYKCPSVSATG